MGLENLLGAFSAHHSDDTVRITLSEHDFRALVAGRVITGKTQSGLAIEIALSDIGFDVMEDGIAEARHQG